MSKARQRQSRVRSAVVVGSLGLVAVLCAAQINSSGSGTTGIQSGSHQTGATPGTSAAGNPSVGPAGPLDAIPSPFPDTSRQKRNDERQRRLVDDTRKLLTLTTQLKAEVASTGVETMSPEMLKQTQEIEKLAKSVKDKMRD